jgi:hypothetical protein
MYGRLSPLCTGRGGKAACGASLQLQRVHNEDEVVFLLRAKGLIDACDWLSLHCGELLHCGERLITDDDAVRISTGRRFAFRRLAVFMRLMAPILLASLE